MDVACHIEAESGNISRATLKVCHPAIFHKDFPKA